MACYLTTNSGTKAFSWIFWSDWKRNLQKSADYHQTGSVNWPLSIQLVDWLSKTPVVQSGYSFWFELQSLFKKVLVYKNYVDCVLHAIFSGSSKNIKAGEIQSCLSPERRKKRSCAWRDNALKIMLPNQ